VQNWNLTELDSGERVISEGLEHVRSVAVGYWIGAGSRDELPAQGGVTHFIEHLLFKGSTRYDALQIAEIFDGLGGELNAATSREHTLVYSRVPDNHLETALDVMGDMVFEPAFEELDAEREVVLEEIAMYEDTPQELVHDLIAEAVFGDHPLGRPVIGTADVISALPRAEIASFHAELYVPRNIVVAAAGNVEHERVVDLVARALERRGEPNASANVRPPLVHAPEPGLRFQRKDTEQYHVCLAAPGIARTDRRRFAASLLDAILGGSASSRLFQEIREKRGLAYSVYSFASQYTDTGQIGVYVGTREDNLVEALAIAADQIADLADGNVSDRELNRAKENLKGRILLSMESTSARMSRLGKSLITDSELLSLDRLVAEIEGVEAASVADLAAAGHTLVSTLADADVMVDFTRPDAVVADVLAAIGGRVPAVVGTTGWDPAEVDGAARTAGVPVLFAPNFAIGAVLMMRFAREAARHLPAAEIIELHHETKLDAPSGTAKATAALLGGGVPIHSVRLPGLVAHQEVLLGGPGQLLTIRHDSTSREAYVPGVLLALERVAGLPAGVTVGLDALL
jgi:predicted Zn-dependent peptidase